MPQDFRILLVRHGQSKGNIDPWYYGFGDLDNPLSEEGWRQAFKLNQFIADFYKENPMDGRTYPQAVDSSPWIRAVQTEEAGTHHFRNNPAIRFRRIEGLREQSFGLLYRQHTNCNSQLAAKLRAAARQYARNPFEAVPPEGDSPLMHSVRVRSVVQDKKVEKDIVDRLVFAHGATNRHYVLAELGLPAQAWKDLENPGNCDAWLLESKDGVVTFKKIYDGESGQRVDIDLMPQIERAKLKMKTAGLMPQ